MNGQVVLGTGGGSDLTRIVSYLEEAARTDTIYRDLYLRRGRALLGSGLDEAEYRRLKRERADISDLLRHVGSAVKHRDWSRVQTLAGQARDRQKALEANRPLLELAGRIYDAPGVPLAPFAPGLPGVTARSPRELAELRDRMVMALATLEREDPHYSDFYADRRRCLQALSMTLADPAERAAAFDSTVLEAEAERALEKGDLNRLERVAASMLSAPAGLPMTTVCPPLASETDLARSFSDDVQRRARGVGLRAVQVDADRECGEYLTCCCVWAPSLPAQPLSPGATAIHGCGCGHVCPPGIAASLKDTLDLLIVHPFVNSAGERYLPRFTAEVVLVEDFPEEESCPASGEMPKLLGLTRRTAASRLELEAMLLRRGPEILEEILGLEARDFRLVCIPFDVYSRLAPAYCWGRQPRWTHFDGYQVWKDNRLRALVGGDVRYGGRHHLCSIGVDDAREEVVARFAVVRRERFAVATNETRPRSTRDGHEP